MYVRRGLKTEAVHPVEYSLTDLFHGVKNKAQVWVFAGLKEAKQRFPFNIVGIDPDYGPEFITKAVQGRLKENQPKTIYIEPRAPWENPFIESFNGKLREECLNRYEFVSVHEAQEIIEAWRIEYNTYRPHSSLNYLTPAEFASQCKVVGEHSSRSLDAVDQGLYPLTVSGT